MNTFDKSTVDKVYSSAPLTAQSLQYGRRDMPFMAFGGTEKPRQVIREYMQGDRKHMKTQPGPKHHYDPANGFGPLGKGAYDFQYGLTWGGEPQIYDTKNFEEKGKYNQMMNMTLAPRSGSENQTGQSTGAIITKQGRRMCTPGYVMKNGICVMQLETPICQPGWYKKDGVCVKAPKEFLAGAPSPDNPNNCGKTSVLKQPYQLGAMGAAPSSNRYPPTKDEVLSMKRLRQYVQERQTITGATSRNGNRIENLGGAAPIVQIGAIVMFLGLVMFFFSRTR